MYFLTNRSRYPTVLVRADLTTERRITDAAENVSPPVRSGNRTQTKRDKTTQTQDNMNNKIWGVYDKPWTHKTVSQLESSEVIFRNDLNSLFFTEKMQGTASPAQIFRTWRETLGFFRKTYGTADCFGTSVFLCFLMLSS